MFRQLSELYGWTPQEIAGLTPTQVAYYLGAQDDDVLVDPTPAQLRRFIERVRRDAET